MFSLCLREELFTPENIVVVRLYLQVLETITTLKKKDLQKEELWTSIMITTYLLIIP